MTKPSISLFIGLLGLACWTIAGSRALLGSSPTRKPRIVYFAPNTPGNPYWPQVFKNIEAAARDLDFEFINHDVVLKDRFVVEQQIIDVFNSEPKPDAAIVAVVRGNTKRVLEVAEARKIPVFIHGPLFPDELPPLGMEPGKKFKYWIGFFYQDEKEKGYQLGKALIAAARKAKTFAKDGKIHAIALGGQTSWYGSILRKEGLEKALREAPEVVLKVYAPTYWTRAEGKELTAKMLNRYPETSIVWAACDQLAIGAVDALEGGGRTPGRNVFTGGLDASNPGMEKVKEGKFEVTTASLMLAFPEIAVYLYDAINGIDISRNPGRLIVTSNHVMTASNVMLYQHLTESFAKINFRKFSRKYTPSLKTYDFSLDALTRAVQ